MKRIITIISLSAVLGCLHLSAQESPRPAPAVPPPFSAVEMETVPNIRYAEVPKVDSNLLSLDIYKPKSAKGAPVLIYVHGGGWKGGDKRGVGTKSADFTARGFIFVSVNYRLVPQVDVLTQLQDSAKAVAWVHSHIAEHGGDAARIFLSGHSAGAHHEAVLGTNERFLKAAGKDLSIIKSVLVLDTQALDVPRLMSGRAGSATYGQAFGADENIWREVSPLHHIAKDKAIPPIIVFYSHGVGASPEVQIEARKPQADAFARALSAAGVRNEVFPAADRSHLEINARFGDSKDDVTHAALWFLEASPPPARPAAKAFALSYAGGTRDAAGRLMGGTELRNLATHGGKLYAGVEMWMDRPGSDPASGAQILVLDKSDGPWRLEHEFAEDLPAGRTRRGKSTKRYEGVTVLESVTFTTDAHDRPLPETRRRAARSVPRFSRRSRSLRS